jgi:hypothetical protein
VAPPCGAVDSSLMHAAFAVSPQLTTAAPSSLPLALWSLAAQVVVALVGIGLPMGLLQPLPHCLALAAYASAQNLAEVQAAADCAREEGGAVFKLAHYPNTAWGSMCPSQQLTWEQYNSCRAHMALPHLHMGLHCQWLGEEMGHVARVPRGRRCCPTAKAM